MVFVIRPQLSSSFYLTRTIIYLRCLCHFDDFLIKLNAFCSYIDCLQLDVIILWLCRAEKSKVLSDEQQTLEKRVEQLRTVCTNVSKKLQGCLTSQGQQTDPEKLLVCCTEVNIFFKDVSIFARIMMHCCWC